MVNMRNSGIVKFEFVHTCGRELERSWLIERIVITFAPCCMKILLHVITSSEKNKGEEGREVEKGRRVGRMELTETRRLLDVARVTRTLHWRVSTIFLIKRQSGHSYEPCSVFRFISLPHPICHWPAIIANWKSSLLLFIALPSSFFEQVNLLFFFPSLHSLSHK